MKKLGYLVGASLLFVPMPHMQQELDLVTKYLLTLVGSQLFVWQQSVLELQFVQNIRNNNEKRFNSKHHLGCGPFYLKFDSH